MPLQNRVLPTGEIVSAPWRGTLMGNRGCLHDPDRTLGITRWRHRHWVCCVTSFRGRHREVMPQPGSPTVYTALFFWDEASAFAAGHRPCAQCRWADYNRFLGAWRLAGLPDGKVAEIDRHLHTARVSRDRRQVTHVANSRDLPVGTFVITEGGPVVMGPDGPSVWQPTGYLPTSLPGRVDVLTPRPVVEIFRSGYTPEIRLHP